MYTEEGFTPAHNAALRGFMDVLNLLLENGADLGLKTGFEGNGFDEVIKQDNIDLFECIYPYSKNLKRAPREPGTFPMLHMAAGAPGSKVLQFLIEKGESVNQVCNEYDRATPLQFAVLAQQEDNVKLLLRHGANPNARDSLGNTPMIFAVMIENLAMVKILDDFGGDASVKNDEGICAIELAQKENNKEILIHFMSQ